MSGIILGLLIPVLGTIIGAAFVYFMKDEMPQKVQKALLGFASGVMVAASVWSLLIPGMEMCEDMGKWSVMPAAVGFVVGMGFLLFIDHITPHLHPADGKAEGPESKLSKTTKLSLAVTIHNGSRCSACMSHAERCRNNGSRRPCHVFRHSNSKHSRRRNNIYAYACCR